MKKLLLLSFIAIVGTMEIKAGNNGGFEAWAEYTTKEFDVNFNIPKGFSEDQVMELMIYATNMPEKKTDKKLWSTFSTFETTARNADGSCLILYPCMQATADTHYNAMNDQIKDPLKTTQTGITIEIYNAVNGGSYYREHMKMQPEWERYITRLGGEKAEAWGGADSVYVVDFPITNAYKNRYNHCIGVFMVKENHLPVCLKRLLDDTGYAQRTKTLKELQDCVKFGSKTLAYNPKEANNAYKEVKAKIDKEK